MRKTEIQLAIPFTFALEGKYHVSIDNMMAEIEISYVQNNEAMDSVRGIQTSGRARVMPDDPEGIMNISKVSIKLPYSMNNHNNNISNEPDKMQIGIPSSIIEMCVLYLNRIREVIRYCTHRYWIRAISPRHLNIYKIVELDDDGKEEMRILFNIPFGNIFPINIVNEADVSLQISEMLKKETRVLISGNLFFDSLSFFHSSLFAEAIIIVNIALETFLEEKLVNKFKSEGKTDEQATKIVGDLLDGSLHKVMKKTYFAHMDNMTRESHPIWLKFDEVRTKRKNVVHPYIKRFTADETKQILMDVLDIVKWITNHSII
jgi:hypothetical protein